VHADFKPDNILIRESDHNIRLADFGTAFKKDEVIEHDIVSRYYRSPEIILGCKKGLEIDMFSFGCCLYEMATGKILLKSVDNNHHIKLILEIFGKFSNNSILKKSPLINEFFDSQFNFIEKLKEKETQNITTRVVNVKKCRNIKRELEVSYNCGSNNQKRKVVDELADLILKCIEIDPKERITPEKACLHPFFDDIF